MITGGVLLLVLIGLVFQIAVIALAVQLGTGKVHGELIALRKAVEAGRTLSISDSNTVGSTGRPMQAAPHKSNKCKCGFPADEPHAQWCPAAAVTH